MSDPIRAALERLHQYAEIFPVHDTDAILAAAHAALAEQQALSESQRYLLARWGHQPTPPAEGEVAQLVAKLRRLAPHNPLGTADPTITRAAELLQQQHPTPVPVSERLPEPKDCDEEGRCWWFDDDDDKWCFDTPYMGARLLCWTHWLPAHALPLPQGEVE